MQENYLIRIKNLNYSHLVFSMHGYFNLIINKKQI
jgi:hypothetical protein